MKHTLGYILGKARDFKLCKECKKVNWHENKECFACGSTSFKNDTKKIEKFIEKEMKYYEEDDEPLPEAIEKQTG